MPTCCSAPPGSGKTEAFRHEARSNVGCYVTARDFRTFDDRPEWRGTTLYIDGLDETRAGSADGRAPFDHIRAKLDRLGKPRIRLSCREADWFGANDRDHLKAVSRDGKVAVLRLDPLTDDDVRYAHDKRADIGVCLDSFTVPVEIRRSCHRGLWSSMKGQLIASYTVDPGADGHGIYVVFWFGNDEHCRPTPGLGSPPRSAAELETQLRDTLTAREQFKISIRVIDVSRPPA